MQYSCHNRPASQPARHARMKQSRPVLTSTHGIICRMQQISTVTWPSTSNKMSQDTSRTPVRFLRIKGAARDYFQRPNTQQQVLLDAVTGYLRLWFSGVGGSATKEQGRVSPKLEPLLNKSRASGTTCSGYRRAYTPSTMA